MCALYAVSTASTCWEISCNKRLSSAISRAMTVRLLLRAILLIYSGCFPHRMRRRMKSRSNSSSSKNKQKQCRSIFDFMILMIMI